MTKQHGGYNVLVLGLCMETTNREREKIKDVSVDEKADAVIYKIIEPGKMQVWNVSKAEGKDYWSAYSPVTIYKVTESEKEEETEEWEPITPDEQKLYAAYSDEKVNFTTDANYF